jgi:hypothetical protein
VPVLGCSGPSRGPSSYDQQQQDIVLDAIADGISAKALA